MTMPLLPMVDNSEIGLEDCGFIDLACKAKTGILRALFDGISQGLEKMLVLVGDMVISPPSFTSEHQSNAQWLAGQTEYLTALLAVVSVMIGGMMLMWQRKAEPLKDILAMLIRLILISAGGVTLVATLSQASDEWSAWMLDEATAGSFNDNLIALFALNPFSVHSGILMAILFGLLAIIAGAIQVVLFMIRQPFLILMVGLWPLSAAATNTDWGRQWFSKLTGWIAAFLLYKPAVAIIFALGLKMMKPDTSDTADGMLNFIQGLLLIGMSMVALPALVKFIVPSTASLGSGGGGGAAAAVGGMAAMKVASGSGGGGARGASGGSQGASPSGAAGATGSAGSSGGASSAGGQVGAGASTGASASAGAAGSAGGAAASGGAAAATGPAAPVVLAAGAVAQTAASMAQGAADSATDGGQS
ncbi:hypothetical protein QP759_07880 [Actinomycetaceae bacterium UMB8039B]|uniref:hypothetical protein n=1 Tax=Pauljensenia sp. UMB8040A TaxID=3046343 RepID=UPI00254B8A02|nr:hypothetical protein [Pauljensenia sp. UMB8040A]MDK7780920.1 hypothetical protein [Actinomycetaceae bacterium UMB8041B]MDK8294420.1 hypothetical protein [Actinomycetaceae bacterium UMB8039B]MDK8608546.1 hypothetical protein [Actinomycetaceae bacterium UMB8041A]MDK8753232.1 hypothetical protein [Actinomycetaceae bacterium UMB8039A]MDK6829905.1 hypothetical protein [Pauljensenia sp. UMB8040A]